MDPSGGLGAGIGEMVKMSYSNNFCGNYDWPICGMWVSPKIMWTLLKPFLLLNLFSYSLVSEFKGPLIFFICLPLVIIERKRVVDFY